MPMSLETKFWTQSPLTHHETELCYRNVGRVLLAKGDDTQTATKWSQEDGCVSPFILQMRRTILSEPWTLFATVNTTERRDEDVSGDRGHKLMGRMDRQLLGWAFNKRRNERSEYYGFAEWTRKNSYHAHFLIAPAVPTNGGDPTIQAEEALWNVFGELYWWPFVERNWTRFQKMTAQQFEEAAKPSLHIATVPLDRAVDRIKITNYVTKSYHVPELRDMAMFRKNMV